MVVPEIRHVLHAYEAVRGYDVVHDHTLMGPFYAERYPGLPVATTIHGPFNAELTDLYRSIANRVPIVAISHAQRRSAPEIPIARVIHHGVEATQFPVGDGAGDEHGPFLLFLGRMADDKGAHRAVEVARKVGMRILMAGKMREALEKDYFHERVEPLLGTGRRVPRRGIARTQAGASRRGLRAPLPHPLERAFRHGHGRGDGLWHTGPRLS